MTMIGERDPTTKSRRRRPGPPRTSRPTPAPTSTSVTAAPSPPKLRRRPMLVVASAALVIIGALTSAWAYSTSTATEQVVAVRTDVAKGAVIDRKDLQVVRISLDPALKVIPGGRLDALVGQHAAVELTAGTLITERAVTSTEVPSPGSSVVGLALGPGQLPAAPLVVGDQVRVVATPGEQGEVDPSSIKSFSGQVVAVVAVDAAGQTSLSVEVPAGQAAELAARSATGKVAVLLDGRDR